MLARLRRLGLLVLGVQVLVTVAFVLWNHLRYATYLRHKGQRPADRPPGRWVEVWTREVVALLLMQAWHLRLVGAQRRWTPREVRGNPVLLCHGFTQNGTNFLRIQRRLRAMGRPSEAILLGYPPRRMDRYVEVFEARLDALCRDFDCPVDVVCHSMGGIVLRMVLSRRPDLGSRLGHVVTVGSPHKGTAAGRGMRLFPEVRFMGRRSAELAALPPLPSLLPLSAVTNVGSSDDTTVYPVETTFEEGARHVRLEGIGHAGILLWDEAVDAIVEALELPVPSSCAPRG